MASLKQLEKEITREAKASEADLLRAHKQLETAIKDEAKGLKVRYDPLPCSSLSLSPLRSCVG